MGRTSRIVVVGAKGVGKTAILEKAIFGNSAADKPYTPTIEDTYVGLVETERGTKEKLQFYDTAGLDSRNQTLPLHYYAVADAFLLVYSITDGSSFKILQEVKKEIDKNKEKKDIPIIVIGNKSDMVHARIVDAVFVDRWVNEEKSRHWETTVNNRETLLEPLIYLASRLNPQPSKGTFPPISMGRKNKD